jgi:WD40 repeat protein
VYNFFLEGGRGYFVMDFLVGETLEEYLSKSQAGSLPAHEVLHIGIQLSSVLDYLQMRQLPIGFKDLSLNAILRTPDGQLYLLDVDSPSRSVPTPSSAAISNLGTTLRQLIGGKQSSRKAVRFAPRFLFRRLRPSRLEHVIEQMVNLDPHKRPVSMRVINQELQHLATQGMADQPFKKLRISRRALLSGLGGLAGLSLASGAGVLVGLSQLQPVPRPDYSSGLGRTIYVYHPSWKNEGELSCTDNTQSDAWVLSVAWSPNGKFIAVGCVDQIACILDITTGHTALNYTGHSKTVEIIAWSPLGHTVASGSDDTTVRVWDPVSGKDINVYRGHTIPVIALAWSPNGAYIASGSWLPDRNAGYTEQQVHVWEARTGGRIVLYPGHSNWVNAVSWSPDGRYVASASTDGTVQIWEAMTGRHVFTYRGHTNAVYTVSWSPDGNYIASGGQDRTVQVWDVQKAIHAELVDKTVAPVAQPSPFIITYGGHSGAINNLAWSPDGRYIASGAYDGTVKLWNAR